MIDWMKRNCKFSGEIGPIRILNIKFGIDPTGDKLHLGHFVILDALNDLAKNHHVTVVLGDYTAQIGDPSGRNKERPLISYLEIENNCFSLEKEIKNLFSNLKIKRNSEWLVDNMQNYFSKVSVNQLLTRKSIKERLKNNKRVSLSELMYPLFQAIDSVHLSSDVEIVGGDQEFNCSFSKNLGHYQSYILFPILEAIGTNEKMSKSNNNCVFLLDSLKDKFNKLMLMNDSQMEHYSNLILKKKLEILEDKLEQKLKLVENICGLFHSKKDILIFKEEWIKENKNKKKIINVKMNKGINLCNFLVENNYINSNNKARSLIKQKGIKVNEKEIEENYKIEKIV